MSAVANVVPRLAKPAPKFQGKALLNGNFVNIELDDYKGKYVVLFFYPMDFTFVCPTEIIAFRTKTPRTEGGLGEIKIPILADPNHTISRQYGVLEEEGGVAFRGLFIIDKAGTLRQATINDMPVGRSVDEVKRLIQAFQHNDEHGEVCPINWKKGDKGIKPGGKASGDN